METVQIIALTMGVAWASGINLYAAIATLGILGGTGSLDLPPDHRLTGGLLPKPGPSWIGDHLLYEDEIRSVEGPRVAYLRKASGHGTECSRPIHVLQSWQR